MEISLRTTIRGLAIVGLVVTILVYMYSQGDLDIHSPSVFLGWVTIAGLFSTGVVYAVEFVVDTVT